MAALTRAGRERASEATAPRTRTDFTVPSQPVRRRRLPEVAAGLLMVTLGALVFLWFVGGDTSRPIAIMATDVSRGAIIEPSHLLQADVSSSVNINAVPWTDVDLLIGKTAAVDLAARSVPSVEDVSDAIVVPDGFRELGLILDLGPVPALDAGAGDIVDVISVLDPKEPTTVAAAVQIRTAIMSPTEDIFFVTLLVRSEDAELVSAAAHNNAIRLVRVS